MSLGTGRLAPSVATVSVVARALGPSGQGLFAVAYTLSLLLIQIGGLGLTTANPYFTARDRASRTRIVGNAVWFAAALTPPVPSRSARQSRAALARLLNVTAEPGLPRRDRIL